MYASHRQQNTRRHPIIQTVVESAFLLASLRRLARPADVPALSPIRSLAYFQPVVEELLSDTPPENYMEYLRLKLRQMTASNNQVAKE